jgi:hypothetical protein
LYFQIIGDTPEFMIIDAQSSGPSTEALAETALRRSEVVGTPLALEVFAVVDAVYMSDGVSEVRAWSQSA